MFNHVYHNALRILCLVAACFSLFACSKDPLPLPKLAANDKIMLFGDGFVSQGTGDPLLTLSAQLADRTGLNVIDAGKKGELTPDGVKRLPGELEAHQPKLLILIHGGTDIYLKKSRETMQANLALMIQESNQRGIPVLLMALPRIGFTVFPAEEYETVAHKAGAYLENDLFSTIIGKPIYLEDQIHPNHKGNSILAQGIADTLRHLGAL